MERKRSVVVLVALFVASNAGCIVDPRPTGDAPQLDNEFGRGLPRDGHVPRRRDVEPTPDDAGPSEPDVAPPAPDANHAGCRARIADIDWPLRPLDIVRLDGSGSVGATRWAWTLVDRPEGGVSVPSERDAWNPTTGEDGPPDDVSTPDAELFVDLVGRYVIELDVGDGCERARLEFEARHDVALAIELTWHTPADPDESDMTGTDVDLHLRHPLAGGVWGQETYDCFFRQREPDWGRPNDPDDNPTLDIDDTNGAGPEQINLAEPEWGAVYTVGVIYFRAESTFGLRDVDPRTEHMSVARVRVYVRGELALDVTGELETVDDLWEAARIDWCGHDGCPRVEPASP